MYNLFVSQSLKIPQIINNLFNQIILFAVGITVSLIFGLTFLSFVYTLSDLIWYAFGIIVPVIPSMIGMEAW